MRGRGVGLGNGAPWLAAAVLVLGCTSTSDSDMLRRSEILCLDQKWEEAAVLLKEYLLSNPDDGGAHFYLGRCYLFAEDFRPAIAEGEYQTALSLFKRGDRKSPIPRFTDQYFELICHIELAKVCLLQIERLQLNGAAFWQLQPLVDKCRRHAKRAGRAMPDAEETSALEGFLAEIERLIRAETNRRIRGDDVSEPG